MNNRIKIVLGCILVMIVVAACVKNKIDFVNGSQITGKLTYENLSLGKIAAPAGTKVNVFFNNAAEPSFTFLTTDSGKYVFSPQSKGNYTFNFSVIDTITTYDSTLVQKLDIDTLRKSASSPIFFTKTVDPVKVIVSDDNTVYTKDVDLTTTSTYLKIQIQDINKVPLPGARVCIYSNQNFASMNAPYCGGCLAYLSTDTNGTIVFTGLAAGVYYINARDDVGSVHINNQYSGATNSATVVQAGSTSPTIIMLK